MSHRQLLVLCLSLATVVAATTTSLSDRVYRLLAERTAQTLGADLILRDQSPVALDEDLLGKNSTLRRAQEISQPSMAFGQSSQQLVSLRAVSESWPLKGELRSSQGPIFSALERGQTWVEQRLADQLGLELGSWVEVGLLRLSVAGILSNYPGRGNAGFASLAPEMLIRLEDLADSGLTASGARSRHLLYLAGDERELNRVQDWAQARQLKADRPGEIRPELGDALARAKGLLDLASLSSLLLLAAVVFLLGRFQLPEWAYQTAVLRSLGASQSYLWAHLGRPWLRDAVLAIAAGGGIALGLQWLLDLWLRARMDLVLPAWRGWPLTLSMLAGLSLALSLLPSLYQAAQTSPSQAFRQSSGDQPSQLWLSLTWVAVCVLLATQLLAIAWNIIIASLGLLMLGASILGLICWLGLRVSGPSAHPLTARRQLAAQPLMSAIQAASLGLGLAIIVLLAGLQSQIIAPWQSQLPPDAPNRFVINIQPEQQQEFLSMLQEVGIAEPRMMPMVRGRLVGLNGRAVSSEDFSDPDTRRWINRDFNLSSATTLGADNKLLEGRFWAAGASEYELSVDTYAVERLDLELGHTLTLDFAGEQRQYTVSSIREVQWDSLQPNFFLLVPPPALPLEQASWITAYYQPAQQPSLDRKLAQRMPNLTILNLDSLIAEIRQITARALLALQAVFGFTLISGALLVLVMLRASVPQRRIQGAILRALGLSRRRLRGLLLREYALLGCMASLGSVLLAQSCLAVLAQTQFNMPFRPQPSLVLLPVFAGVLISASLGWWQLRSTTTTPPTRLLKES